MLFQRMAQCLIEENDRKKGFYSFFFRTPGGGIAIGLILWTLYLFLCWAIFSPKEYRNSTYDHIALIMWLFLTVFSAGLAIFLDHRINKGTLNTKPGLLSDRAIKILTYLLAISPTYLFLILFIVILVCLGFGII